MSKGKVRTIGISILGGNAHVSGRFELGVDYVGALQSVSSFSCSALHYIECSLILWTVVA